MTKNQIEYNKLLETRRSNLKNEELTAQRDQAAREAKIIELQELARHNQAQEGLTGRGLDIQQGSLDETARHNRRGEAITLSQLGESIRHNQVSEAEIQRHNKAGEQAQIIQLNETQRHNLATEQETATHNRATESETHRHNVVGEATDASRIALDTVTREQQMAETKRHNMAMEIKDLSPKVSVSNSQTAPVSTESSQRAEPSTQDVPTSDMIGHYYMSRVTSDGQRHRMYAYETNSGERGFGKVLEDRQGREYIITRSGKKMYLP